MKRITWKNDGTKLTATVDGESVTLELADLPEEFKQRMLVIGARGVYAARCGADPDPLASVRELHSRLKDGDWERPRRGPHPSYRRKLRG